MACLGETWPSVWVLTQSAFVQDPVHLDGRKEEINTASPQGLPF